MEIPIETMQVGDRHAIPPQTVTEAVIRQTLHGGRIGGKLFHWRTQAPHLVKEGPPTRAERDDQNDGRKYGWFIYRIE